MIRTYVIYNTNFHFSALNNNEVPNISEIQILGVDTAIRGSGSTNASHPVDSIVTSSYGEDESHGGKNRGLYHNPVSHPVPQVRWMHSVRMESKDIILPNGKVFATAVRVRTDRRRHPSCYPEETFTRSKWGNLRKTRTRGRPKKNAKKQQL